MGGSARQYHFPFYLTNFSIKNSSFLHSLDDNSEILQISKYNDFVSIFTTQKLMFDWFASVRK